MLSRGLRRWLVLAAVVAGLVGAYAAFGFFGVPRLIRSNLESFVSTHYSRRVSVGDIRFNPFTLTLDVRAFSLPDADGRPMLRFDRLFVKMRIVSIWRRGPSFREISLESPFARVLIRHDGSLNLADLGKGFPAGPKPKKPPSPLRLYIDKLSVRQGRTVYEDVSRRDPFVAELTPITFDLHDFSTTARTGNDYSLEGASEAGERFSWSGNLSLNPLASRGHFQIDHLLAHTLWSYAHDSLAFEVPSGTIGLSGNYDFTSAGNPIGLTVTVQDLTVSELALRPRGKDTNYVELTRVEVQGTQVDLARRSVQIEKVHLAGGDVRAWRDANGSINLQELASNPASPPGPSTDPSLASTPGPGKDPAAASTATAVDPPAAPVSASATRPPAPSSTSPPPSSPSKPSSQSTWTVSAPDIVVDGLKVSAEDRQVMPVFAMTLDPLNVHVAGFTTAPGTDLDVEADAGINGAGKVKANAHVSPQSGALSAHTELTGVDLTAFQPYVSAQTSMTLLSGLLGTKLDIKRGKDGVLSATGDTQVTKLRTVDNALQKDFIKWSDLRVSGMEFRSQPAKLRIKRIDAREPYARVIIAANEVLNITEVLTPSAGQQQAAAAQPARALSPTPKKHRAAKNTPRAPPEQPAPSQPSMEVSIGTVRFVNGSAHFADFSIQPNYAVAIQTLNGAVDGLSTDPTSRATVKLEGKVDRYAPVNIDGTVNLLSAATYSDIKMSFKGVEMSSVTPYSGRFAGYKIDKGKLSADLNYHIDQRKLKADHHIVIDQLQLGEKVDSPDATKLPLKLAVALLKDRNGVIDLGLPVTGSLDDPKFRLWPLIWKVVVNLLTKAATAPFALLGHLVDGGEQMNFIDFKPGSAALEPPQQDKVTSVGKAMKERPQLQLDVPMAFSAELDRPVLAQQALKEKLMALQQQEGSGRKHANPNEKDPAAALSDPPEHYRLLVDQYRTELGKDAPLPDSAAAIEAAKKKKGETPAYDPAIADLERALTEKVEVTDSDLEKLGTKRAHSIQDVLLGNGEIDAARVFLINSAPKADTKDAVRIELALK